MKAVEMKKFLDNQEQLAILMNVFNLTKKTDIGKELENKTVDEINELIADFIAKEEKANDPSVDPDQPDRRIRWDGRDTEVPILYLEIRDETDPLIRKNKDGSVARTKDDKPYTPSYGILNIGESPNVETEVITLSAKQLNRLCRLNNIPIKSKAMDMVNTAQWNRLSLQVEDGKAIIAYKNHLKGEPFINQDGTEDAYGDSWQRTLVQKLKPAKEVRLMELKESRQAQDHAVLGAKALFED